MKQCPAHYKQRSGQVLSRREITIYTLHNFGALSTFLMPDVGMLSVLTVCAEGYKILLKMDTSRAGDAVHLPGTTYQSGGRRDSTMPIFMMFGK